MRSEPFKRLHTFIQALAQISNNINLNREQSAHMERQIRSSWFESKGRGNNKRPHKLSRHGAHMDFVRAAKKKRNIVKRS